MSQNTEDAKNQAPAPSSSLTLFKLVAFYLALTVLILLNIKPIELRADSRLLTSLISGTQRGYVPPGNEIGFMRSQLPREGVLSILMDAPVVKGSEEAKRLGKMQNRVAPVILNPAPGEPFAVVFCSSDAIANKRMQETGYQMVMRMKPGKGIAVKKL